MYCKISHQDIYPMWLKEQKACWCPTHLPSPPWLLLSTITNDMSQWFPAWVSAVLGSSSRSLLSGAHSPWAMYSEHFKNSMPCSCGTWKITDLRAQFKYAQENNFGSSIYTYISFFKLMNRMYYNDIDNNNGCIESLEPHTGWKLVWLCSFCNVIFYTNLPSTRSISSSNRLVNVSSYFYYLQFPSIIYYIAVIFR